MNTVLGALVGYGYAQIPPYHDRTKGKASVLVLSCIDPRYTNDLAWNLTHRQDLHADYDLISLAGASLGVFHSDAWKSVFLEHIDLALKLHGISEVWVYDHLDCGMYKATFNMKTDDDDAPHLTQLKELKELLFTSYPKLKFKGHIISIEGHIKEVKI